MNNLQLLSDVLEYIEENISENLRTDDIAAHCFCSRSALEKLFKNVNHMSVHDYIVKRKMVIAARKLKADRDTNILFLALSLGYNSNEAFTRAFRRVWNCNPSEFASVYRFTDLFPRMYSAHMKGELIMRKNVDISELYDLFSERRDCFFVCCDIKHMTPINEISYRAGDFAILESMKRMSEAAGDNDVVFRIGGDEFAMLTDSQDRKYAEKIADSITAGNGEEFEFEGKRIPLSLYASVTRAESRTIRYNELFNKLHTTIEINK